MTESTGMSRRGLLGAVAGVAAAATAVPAWGVDDQRPGAVRAPALDRDDRHIVNRLSSERALRHLEAMSEEIGPRIGGTASEKRAADYLVGQLRSYGYETRYEPFPVADKFLAQIGDPRNLLLDDMLASGRGSRRQAGRHRDRSGARCGAGDCAHLAGRPRWRRGACR